jgi:predicted glycogen debranching enzyme
MNQTLRLGPEICRNLDASLSREWLETNGLGGYASSTVSSANTRRYHGLLVAATKPPVGRMVLLSKLEESIAFPDGPVELSCNLFPDAVHPAGYRYLEEFRLDPWPVWRWNIDSVRLEKSVCLLHGRNAVVVEYRLLAGGTVPLDVRPLITARDYHSLGHAGPQPPQPNLHFLHPGAQLTPTGDWYYRFEYPHEQERGLDYEEDLYQPFVLRFPLTTGSPVHIVAATEPCEAWDTNALLEQERSRRLPSSTAFEPALRRAAEQFTASRGNTTTLIAGYHWFTDWGRDTMISLPGLTLANGQPEFARSILETFLPTLNQGVIPNRFPDFGEEPEYNSSDASLQFVAAIQFYLNLSDDIGFVGGRCYPALKEIVEWRERGTFYNIHMDAADGLLSGGAPGAQLTWMDAKVNGRVITERSGKPVEIQALWYNTLRFTASVALRVNDQPFAQHCEGLAAQCLASFNTKFWNESAGCLYDVIDGDQRDASIRPNQLAALAIRMVEGERAARALEVVRRELLTPYGLRTLSPRDPRYHGRYEGNQESRDEAYHQGTVWPWLLGPYARALFAVHGKTPDLLAPFSEHLLEAGLGQISEIFDGDPPHAPRGCIAQAWSVAQLLEIAPQGEAGTWPARLYLAPVRQSE